MASKLTQDELCHYIEQRTIFIGRRLKHVDTLRACFNELMKMQLKKQGCILVAYKVRRMVQYTLRDYLLYVAITKSNTKYPWLDNKTRQIELMSFACKRAIVCAIVCAIVLSTCSHLTH